MQGWNYDDLGNVTRITYPRCAHTYCSGPALTSRLVDFTYTNGTLTSIPGYASPIAYNANGTLSSVAHANGVTWSQTPDPNSMPRPAAIQAAAGMSTLWSTGTHSYDGEGNVRAIGSSSFIYDPVSRLTSASMITGPLGTGGPLTQGFTYDGFGNMTAISGSNGRNIPTSSATNRLTTVGAGPTCEVNETYYDAAGNLLCWQGNSFTYDPLGSVTRSLLSGNEYDHAYNAAGERLMTYQPGVGFRWTFRDLDGRVLREFKNTDTVERDYVYRHGTPLASVQPNGEVFHLHPDHLGSPRLVTRNGGLQRAFHTYFAYGEEATAINQDAERLKFTGHERDLGIPTSAADDIDYQHARYYSQLLGRYLSPDPIGGDLGRPQSWNRYAYALGNPMKYVDPWGLDEGTPLDNQSFDCVQWIDGICINDNSTKVSGRPPAGGLPWWFWFAYGNRGGQGGGSGGGARGTGTAIVASPPLWLSPTNDCVRGCDSRGCGSFGASRNRNGVPGKHEGVDFISSPGQDVYAPTAGTITREIRIIYQGDSRYTGVEMSTPQGHQIKLLYLSLNRSLVGTTIDVGDTIGNAQDLQPRYPGITDHIHLQIRDAAGSLVDPLSLIQLPPHCP